MAKVKIYELAKELSMESKDIMKKLQKMGVEVKSHMSTITEKQADAIRAEYETNHGSSSGADGGFVPRVKRIPKSVIEKEHAQHLAESESSEQPIPAKDEEFKPKDSVLDSDQVHSKHNVSSSSSSAMPSDIDMHTDTKPDVLSQPDADKNPIPEKHDSSLAKTATPAEVKDTVTTDLSNNQTSSVNRVEKDIPKADQQPVSDSNEIKQQVADEIKMDNSTRNNGKNMTDRETASLHNTNSNNSRDNYHSARNGQRPPRDGQRSDSRPPRDGQRPPRDGQRSDNRPPRDGQRPPRDGQRSDNRPPRDGQRPVRQQDRGRKDMSGGVFDELPIAEKPNSNYRPNNNKKAFVKDMVLERASAVEKNIKNKGFSPKGKPGKKGAKNAKKETKAVMPPVTPKKIVIDETVVLGELAKTMGKTAGEVIKVLFGMGIMATINQELDADTAILLAGEFGITVEVKADKTAEVLEDFEDNEGDLEERPPVVTIMGHVDHGKTSLLDAIRHTNVISTEAGGITQHIGAYQVEINGRKITFLDTPGHEAFTSMRARGAQITDVAIIVVAADDGVMPQTVEAINHSKAAGVPIIIAINKIDKPGANPDRVKQELMEHGLVAEEWGGDTIMVPVSAKAKINLEGLLEMILLVSEVAELKANPDRQARGAVVEAKLDKSRGPVTTLLVQKGTLHIGDNILAGSVFGKVRAMHDDKGRRVKAAGPSTPVEIMGFSEVPPSGEIFIVVKDEKDARAVAARLQAKRREEELRKTSKVSLDDLFKQIAEGEIKELNVIVKADVNGSAEALTQSLIKLNTDDVKVNVIHAGVGGISESDVLLASASNALIIGFNIVASPSARAAAETEKVDIRLYRVIYDAIEDVKKAMSGLLAPEYKENIIGHAEVRAVFKVPKAGMVAGSYITHGKIVRNALIRVIRNSVIVAEDKIDSLRRFKDDVKEVVAGFECGIGLENFNDIKEGDILEAYIMEEVLREL